MARKTNAARKPAARKATTPPAAPPPAPAPGPNGYAEREGRGAAPVLPIAGGGLATWDAITSEPLEWLIPGIIPRNELVLAAGPSQCGKSTFFASLIAHCTGGRSFNGCVMPPPGRAILYALEASAGGAPLDQLRAAGAEMSRVVCGTRLPSGAPAPLPYLPGMQVQLTQQVMRCRASLLVIDPLDSLLGPGVNVSIGADVRAVLGPLQRLAQEGGVTIVFTRNFRKSTEGDPSNWISGHKDWYNMPRHVLGFGRDPKRPERFVLAVAKQSRGKIGPSLGYRIVERDGGGWMEPMGLTDTGAQDLGMEPDDDLDRTARELARAYLRRVLADVPERCTRLLQECQGGGFSPRTLERAAADLGVTKEFRVEGQDRAWYWIAPEEWPD